LIKISGANRRANASDPDAVDRVTALCFGTLTTKFVFAPDVPGVTVAGLNVYDAPDGKFDALIDTELVNDPFIEPTTMANVADAPGGINCLPVLEETVKSARETTTTSDSPVTVTVV